MRCLLLHMLLAAGTIGVATAAPARVAAQLTWEMNAAEPAAKTKPKVAEPIVIAYIPEHLQHRVPGHQHKHRGTVDLQYVPPPTPAEDPAQEQRRRALGFGIGLGLGIPLLMVAVISTVAIQNTFESWE